MTLGEQVRAKRIECQLSTRDLGIVTGLSAATISRIERNIGSLDYRTGKALESWLAGDPVKASKPELASKLWQRVLDIESRIEALEAQRPPTRKAKKRGER